MTQAGAGKDGELEFLRRLSGGVRRSIGGANAVVAEVLAEPALFSCVFWGMLESDPVVRMRAADVVEKVTRERPELLRPFKAQLLDEVGSIDQQEVRWHVAQMVGRLDLDQTERDKAVAILKESLQHSSNIVRTFALQAVADLAKQHGGLRSEVLSLVEEQVRRGSPAVRSRGRRILVELKAIVGREPR